MPIKSKKYFSTVLESAAPAKVAFENVEPLIPASCFIVVARFERICSISSSQNFSAASSSSMIAPYAPGILIRNEKLVFNHSKREIAQNSIPFLSKSSTSFLDMLLRGPPESDFPDVPDILCNTARSRPSFNEALSNISRS